MKTQPADGQRRTMECLRTMCNSKNPFALRPIYSRHGLQGSIGSCLAELGWTEKMGKGARNKSKWVGPHPHSEEELFRMASILRDRMATYPKRTIENRYGKALKVNVAPVLSPNVKEEMSVSFADIDKRMPKPKNGHANGHARTKLSLFWGLFKVEVS